MTHLRLHNHLKDIFSLAPSEIDWPDELAFRNYDFVSAGTRHSARKPQTPPTDLQGRLPATTNLGDLFTKPDSEIAENVKFRHFVVGPRQEKKSDAAIILLHGLNERFWDKYLPMAAHLTKTTGKSVLCFPTAFHMNRAPALWTDARAMRAVSQWRKLIYPNILECSLSNAAISHRLEEDASRFFWSGLQTYGDIVSLTRSIRAGEHPAFAPGASVDFFTYSIGCYISELLFMANEDNLFSDSRLVLFCGGPVFSRMNAVSKFILDSKADEKLGKFLIENLPEHRKNDPFLDENLGKTEIGRTFLSMIEPNIGRQLREKRLRGMAGRVKALALELDTVVPAGEVIKTLKGYKGDIPISISVANPDYPYRHEDPFPTLPKHEASVDRWFKLIMDEAANFLR
ncbi:MAG: DUF6051 family protein [Deltaproteobacteria bacterium]|jgi:hypothetical protein|nr:DUF6051 family protein [Deltaproteobacteria bacterium]